jgi:hypothetical protein
VNRCVLPDVTWTLPDRFFEMRDPKLVAPTEFLLSTGEIYDNPRRLPEKWLQAYLSRHPQLLAIDVMRAWDKSQKIERRLRFQAYIAVINFATAVLGLALMLAKFLR